MKRLVFFFAAVKIVVLAWWLHKLGWGTIDDAYHWELAHGPGGFVSLLKHLITLDADAGMFRPVYNLYMMGGYRLFESNPQGFYALCWALLLVPAFFMARLWLTLTDRPSTVAAVALTCALFAYEPWTQLFSNLSLQEKLGLLWAAVALTLLHRGKSLLALGATTLMLLSKATFISHGPPFLALLYLFKPKQWRRGLVAQTLAFTAAAFYFMSIRKGYTSGYSVNLQNYADNIPKAGLPTWLLWLVALAAPLPYLFRGRRTPLSKVAVVGAVGVLSASAVMVPWASTDYYMSILAPWALALAAAGYAALPQGQQRGLALLSASALGFAGLFIHLVPQFRYNHEMREVTTVLTELRMKGKHLRAYLGACNETRDSLDHFSRPHYARRWNEEEREYFVRSLKNLVPGKPQIWVESSRCSTPVPGGIIVEPVLYESRHWRMSEINVLSVDGKLNR